MNDQDESRKTKQVTKFALAYLSANLAEFLGDDPEFFRTTSGYSELAPLDEADLLAVVHALATKAQEEV